MSSGSGVDVFSESLGTPRRDLLRAPSRAAPERRPSASKWDARAARGQPVLRSSGVFAVWHEVGPMVERPVRATVAHSIAGHAPPPPR